MAEPIISVLIPVYNCRPYLGAAMDSILSQSFEDFEVVVIDDGSTDGSSEDLAALASKDARIKIFQQENQGLPKALRRGQQECRGRYIARMDGDDIATPDRLAKQLAYMEQNPDVGICGAYGRTVDSEGDPMQIFQPPLEHGAIDAKLMEGRASAIIHPLAFMRKEALERAGGYRIDEELEDLGLFLRLAETTQMANIPEVMLDYRMHLKSTNYQRRLRHAQLTQEIVERAWKRRELHGNCPQLQLPHRDDDLARITADWARTAFTGCYYKTGWKHTKRIITKGLFSATAWYEFARTIRWGIYCHMNKQDNRTR